jgi:2,4-dienoyl-CoA reductase-like NADH-dependent reductase (Old Yellow Enzyme family)/nucleotide-binding universal stress UspA family protein
MPKFPCLFEPFIIPPFHLKNRITMAPLFTAYAHRDGTVSQLTLDHYKEVAQGGAAMIVVGNAAIDPSGTLSQHSLRADDDRFLPGLSHLAETIKKEGAVATLQINHGGRFARGETLYAPSSIFFSDINFGGLYKTAFRSLNIQQQWAILSEAFHQRPRRSKKMTVADIQRIITAYAKAAARAKKAGFDMVEIHGATGYLPVQFLSPRTNKRKDRYGGDLENRMRFPVELTERVKDTVGSDFPVGYRFLADEWIPGGFSIDEAKIFAGRLSALRIAYLSVTGGTYESFAIPEIIEKSHEPGYMVYLARQIKALVNVPVITAGRITTPDLAEEILREKKADLIGLARPLFADPQWPEKAQTGKENAIVPCKDCGTCFQCVVADRPALCMQWGKTKLIKRKSMVKEMQNPRKKILVTMDGSEHAIMGAAYAGDMLANRKDVTVTLFHIQTDESIKNENGIREMMDIARSFLVKAGIPEEAITVQIRKKKAGIGNDILDEIAAGGYGTVVVGRRGGSIAQQLLFGSVSGKIVQNAQNCTVWVVE